MNNIRTQNSARPKRKKKNKSLRYILMGLLLIFIAAAVLFFQYIAEGLPSLDELENPQAQLASNVYSVDGELIGQFFKENRVEVSIDSIPPLVINALIATEDKNFYSHWGVDLQRFVKAMLKNIFLFKREGASTITQQLAKNLYKLKTGKESIFDTGIRKLQEWITAIQIEKTYTKREILEMYFNISFFGHGAYGLNMAAKVYFDKEVKDLTVSDAGILVAVLKSPVYYDPFERYENSMRRRNIVIKNMVVNGFLDEDEYNRLKELPIKLSYKKYEEGISATIAPHFLEYVRQQLEKLSGKYGFNLYRDGLNIYTTLDSRMQRIANNASAVHLESFQKQFDKSWNWNRYPQILKEVIDKSIRNRIEYKSADRYEKSEVYNFFLKNKAFIDSVKKVHETIEVGFVALDTKTGAIRALVGGRNQKFLYGLNHVTQIRRQPGSAFKPIVYAVAIDNGLYPAYPILNQRFVYTDGWSPQNFDKEETGFETLREAMRESLNIVAAKLIVEDYAPMWKILRFAEKMGIKSKLDPYPSISLGTSLITPLELAAAYATLGNHGIYNEPISILKIEDKNGMLIDKFTNYASEAIPEETAYLVTDMMRTSIDHGTGASARYSYNFTRPAAGKTGTTQDYADAWFCGFTPQLTANVWVGFDDQRISFTGDYGQGARAALPIWAVFMRDVYEQLQLPEENFSMPASGNIVSVKYCRESIFELGDPKIYSSDCRGGEYTDISNVKDIPDTYDAFRDTEPKLFNRYNPGDSSSRQAHEIR